MANRVTQFVRAMLAGAAVALAPSAANAESAARWLKTEALIGQPSALEAILAAQNGTKVPIRTPQPMSYSRPSASQLGLAEARGDEGATSGRPDLFGSVALPVRRTSLDDRWNRAGESAVSGAAASFAEGLTARERVERLDAVNRYVNARVRFVDDQVQFGKADVWSPAPATLKRGAGDCEDYAIAKMAMLRRAGFAERDLYLVIVRDLVRRSDHAVLAVRAEGRMYVLDNGTDALLESGVVADYRPIMTFAATGAWTHGYRRTSQPVQYASNEVGRAVAPATGN